MLNGKDIIYFSNDWSASHRTSSHHIARELMKNNRILYVETGGIRPPKRSIRDLKRILSRLFSWLRFVRKVSDNFYIYSLFILPFHNKLAYRLNIYLNIFFLKRAIRRLGLKDPVLWFIAPHVSYLADHLPKSLIVYYCTDNLAEAPGADRRAIERNMEELLKKSDIVFATSGLFYETLKNRNINSNIYYSPHVVDFRHFSKAQDKKISIPPELKGLKRPIIGFMGIIEEKMVDLKLISYIARSRPDWSIVLIGDVRIGLDTIAGLDNVICAGHKDYDELPSYLKAFDAVMIPFLINEFTRNANPLKLKEYLAAGKPVISTRLPEVEKFKGLVEIADSYEDFVSRIENAYKADNSDKIRERMESVSSESWSALTEKISGIIENTQKSQP